MPTPLGPATTAWSSRRHRRRSRAPTTSLASSGSSAALERASSSLWLGADDALARFGVRRGQTIERDDLIAVLQGQHVQTGEQLRRPGMLKREAHDEHGQALVDDDGRPVVERVTGVAHVEMTMSVPKSVSVLWAMADQDDRARIEQAAARRGGADGAVHGAQQGGRSPPWEGWRAGPGAGGGRGGRVVAACDRAGGRGVIGRRRRSCTSTTWWSASCRTDGQLVAADSWEWFRHDAALEGGALFRAQVADALVNAGWAIRSGTGDRGRYFEVEGVPESLCEVMSPRSREVAEARVELERELGIRLQGGALAVLAKETRQAKDHDLDPEQAARGVGRARPGARTSAQARAASSDSARVISQTSRRGWRGRAGWCSHSCASRARRSVSRALARSCSRPPPAGCRPTRRPGCWRGWSARTGGELLALEGGRVTSREIRQLEQHVIDVAVTAASRRPRPRRSARRIARPGCRPQRRRSVTASSWTPSSAKRSSCSFPRHRLGVSHRAGGDREGADSTRGR